MTLLMTLALLLMVVMMLALPRESIAAGESS
jgi:hypothetical protein